MKLSLQKSINIIHSLNARFENIREENLLLTTFEQPFILIEIFGPKKFKYKTDTTDMKKPLIVSFR